MRKSAIFHTDRYLEIQDNVKTTLNSHDDFLSTIANSPRVAGDAVERILGSSFSDILGDVCADYSADFARRAMADLAFTDTDGLYYIVDVKTHRTDTRFNMPNLTSVQRLSRFYEDDNNTFALLIVSYHLEEETRAQITDVKFLPIEFLSWDCLTVGALGWGQIQIANANKITVLPQYSRKQWMIELCDVLLTFYPKEIAKIGERLQYFEEVRQFWSGKPEE